MRNSIRSKLSNFRIYQIAHSIKSRFIDIEKRDAVKPIIKKLNSNKKASLLFFTPTHINIGDHAIALAEIKMLNASNIDFIEVTDTELYTLQRFNSLDIFNGRKILFHGGGYLGTLWFKGEHLLREVIVANPKSRIILFPNTIYYEDNDFGKSELNKSIQIYNSHKNITIYARERVSFELVKEIYNDVQLCPDMVLSLNEVIPIKSRNGCLVCFRSDIEKTLQEDEYESILKQLSGLFNDITLTDMYSDERFITSQRKDIVEKKLNEFRNAQLVVTDRLHAMIFSAITGTPCIIIDSKSHKVRGCYDWIKDLGYIRFCENYSQIAEISKSLIKMNDNTYDNCRFSEYYKQLIDTIKA